MKTMKQAVKAILEADAITIASASVSLSNKVYYPAQAPAKLKDSNEFYLVVSEPTESIGFKEVVYKHAIQVIVNTCLGKETPYIDFHDYICNQVKSIIADAVNTDECINITGRDVVLGYVQSTDAYPDVDTNAYSTTLTFQGFDA